MPPQLTFRQDIADFRRISFRFCKEQFGNVFYAAMFSSLLARHAASVTGMSLFSAGLFGPGLFFFEASRLSLWIWWLATVLAFLALTYLYSARSLRRIFLRPQERVTDITISLHPAGLFWHGPLNRVFVAWNSVRKIHRSGTKLIVETSARNFGPICIQTGSLPPEQVASSEKQMQEAKAGRLRTQDSDPAEQSGVWPPLPAQPSGAVGREWDTEQTTLIGLLKIRRGKERLGIRRRPDLRIFTAIVALVIGTASGADFWTLRPVSHSFIIPLTLTVSIVCLVFASVNLRDSGDSLWFDLANGTFRLPGKKPRPLIDLDYILVQPNGKTFLLWFKMRSGKPELLTLLAAAFTDQATAIVFARQIGIFLGIEIKKAAPAVKASHAPAADVEASTL